MEGQRHCFHPSLLLVLVCAHFSSSKNLLFSVPFVQDPWPELTVCFDSFFFMFPLERSVSRAFYNNNNGNFLFPTNTTLHDGTHHSQLGMMGKFTSSN